jgi:ABC-type dipeptide/oligopeptide/nickel transport system permease subunit
MSSEDLALAAPRRGISSRPGWRHPWRAPGLLVPLAFVLLLATVVCAPQWFTTLAPDAVNTDAILQPPGADHWFGTDELGRDLFTRVIYGTSLSLRSASAQRRSPAWAESLSARGPHWRRRSCVRFW